MAIQFSPIQSVNTIKRTTKRNITPHNRNRRNTVAFNQSLTCTDQINGLTPHPLAYSNAVKNNQ